MKIIEKDIWLQKSNWRKKLIKSRKPDTKTKRIFIAGLGRAGTTFLVQLLTRLGLDTGMEAYKENRSEDVRAGGELGCLTDNGIDHEVMTRTPRIVKGPLLSIALDQIFTEKIVPVEHVIVPIRNVKATALSREQTKLWFLKEHEFLPIEVRIPNLFSTLGKVFESCTLFDVPHTTIAFPRLVEDPEYLWSKLKPIFGKELNRRDFMREYKKLAKPEMIQTKI